MYGEGIEIPDDARGQRRGSMSRRLERAHDHVVMLGAGRRDREAAVACHHGGDAVEARRLRSGSQKPARSSGCGCRLKRRNGAARRVELAHAAQVRPDFADHPAAIATSAMRPGAPLPSKTVPPRMTSSADIRSPLASRARKADRRDDRPARTLDRTGTPLSEEPGLGALTIPGYLREVTTRFAEREALVVARRRVLCAGRTRPCGSVRSRVARALLATASATTPASAF